MRLPLLLLASLLLAGCAGAADSSQGSAGEGAAPGIIAGVVVDDAIRPLAGVCVTLDGGAANTTTEGDGLFQFEGVATGAHVVRATKGGHADAVTQVTVECGLYFGSYFAACGAFNVGSFIVCAQTNVCMGNLTGDRYIVIERFDRTPTFLVAETVWTSTQALGEQLSVWLQSATQEQLRFYPETPSVWNRTSGPSPLYGTMDSEMLVESGIGAESYFLAQVFAEDEDTIPINLGATVQQKFQMFLTLFYGYVPPSDWRFTEAGAAPPPPA